MDKTDNDEVLLIKRMEDICFPEEPWSLENVKSAVMRTDTVYKVLAADSGNSEDSGSPIGYYIASLSFDEAELYRIAVLPKYRGRGYGSVLMEDFLKSCPKVTERIFLEVRESNAAAIGLYEKNGFEIISRRKKYYGNEDGLIYCLTVKRQVFD